MRFFDGYRNLSLAALHEHALSTICFLYVRSHLLHHIFALEVVKYGGFLGVDLQAIVLQYFDDCLYASARLPECLSVLYLPCRPAVICKDGQSLLLNAPTGRLAGLSVQQKHVDAQKMLHFTVFLALEGS